MLKNIVRAGVPRAVRNSLRSPSRSLDWLWDRAAFRLGRARRLAVLPHWSIACHPEAFRVMNEAQVADPEQRREFLSFVSYCSPGTFLFDIGAHFGIFSLATAHFGGRAVAVDPSPAAVRMIELQAQLNGFHNAVQAMQAAVSDSCGVRHMLSSGVFSHGYFRFANRPTRELTEVVTTTVDEMVKQFGVPTHIKVDVEGHELSVVRGAKATLRASCPTLFLELHNDMVRAEGRDPELVLDELAGMGYLMFDTESAPVTRTTILNSSIIRTVARHQQTI